MMMATCTPAHPPEQGQADPPCPHFTGKGTEARGMNRLRVTGGASGRGGVQPRQADRDQLRGMIQGSAETHFVHYLPTPNHQPRSPPDPQLRGEAAAQPLDPGHMDQSRLGNQKLPVPTLDQGGGPLGAGWGPLCWL